jgi:glycosyltransferase involved in cell wall biosynthesis
VYDEQRLGAYYEQAAVFAYPSLAERGEASPLAPLEAMAWGAAPVVSNLDCFQDFILDGHNGLIFEHRGSGAVAALAETLSRASATFQRLGHRALDVRRIYAIGRIAGLFLEEFERIHQEKLKSNATSS